MSGVLKIDRTTFEISRELEFFTEKELQMQIGYGREWWSVAMLKELIETPWMLVRLEMLIQK